MLQVNFMQFSTWFSIHNVHETKIIYRPILLYVYSYDFCWQGYLLQQSAGTMILTSGNLEFVITFTLLLPTAWNIRFESGTSSNESSISVFDQSNLLVPPPSDYSPQQRWTSPVIAISKNVCVKFFTMIGWSLWFNKTCVSPSIPSRPQSSS